MPLSRKRRRPSRRRPPRRHRATSRIVSVPLRDLVLGEPGPEAVACMARSLAAGARGDARACLTHELSGPVLVESLHRFAMQDLVDQGDLAPAWAYSRWCLDLAYRSMLMACDPRTDEAVRLVMCTLHPQSAARAGSDADELRFLGTLLASSDHVVEDIALFELGGLSDYITQVAEPGLLTRTDRIGEWPDAALGAYAREGFQGCRSVLRDLVTGERVEVLNLGSSLDGRGDALLGRLVPISAEPGRMFATHPMCVDDATAAMVADALRSDEPLGWLFALATAMDLHALPEGFHHTPITPFTSDLPIPEVTQHPEAPSEAARMVELRAKGHCAEVAEAVGVLEVGLIAAEVSDQAAAVVAPHVAAALAVPEVYAAARAECTTPETAQGWRILAGVVPDHLSERCLLLASRADAAPSS